MMPRIARSRAQPTFPTSLVRHSRAVLQSATEDERARTIHVALFANIVIAQAKLTVGLLSGSVAMLGEAGHSFADSLNEALLGVSLRRARRRPGCQASARS